jgi:hypothetical protein
MQNKNLYVVQLKKDFYYFIKNSNALQIHQNKHLDVILEED